MLMLTVPLCACSQRTQQQQADGAVHDKFALGSTAAGFGVLRVAGCPRLGRRGLAALAAVGAFARLRELDVSHLDGLWAKPVRCRKREQCAIWRRAASSTHR